MAEIRVEKKRHMSWMWLLLAALALLLLFWGLTAVMSPEREVVRDPQTGVVATQPLGDQQGNVQAGREASLVIPYDGREWIPMDVDQAARFNDDQMNVVATVNGVNLYATDEAVGGGGGAIDVPDERATQPYGRVYVRMADGRYLPMVWRSEVQ